MPPEIQTALKAAGVAAGLLATAFVVLFVPIVLPASPDPNATMLEAQRLDLLRLRTLPRYDRSFEEHGAAERLQRYVDSVLARRHEFSQAEFEVVVARAAAIADNGHTSASAAGRRDRLGDDLPVRLARFAEGFFIVQAAAPHAQLLGARVDSIGELEVDSIVARLATLYGGAPARAHYYAHLDLTSPSLLHAIGATAAPTEARLALVTRDGSREVVVLPALVPADRRRPVARAAYLHGEFDTVPERWRTVTAAVEPPLPLARPGTRFDMARIADGRGYYVRIDANTDGSGQDLGRFVSDAVDSIVALGPSFGVVDLRHNAGGTTALGDFAEHLANVLPDSGRLYVIMSGGTFSYGIATAALLRKHGGARTIIVGEPPGDRLRFWANGGTTFRLPNSGIALRAWSGLEDYADGCHQPTKCFWFSPFFRRDGIGQLAIQVPAQISFADYLRGRDTALDTILALEMPGRRP